MATPTAAPGCPPTSGTTFSLGPFTIPMDCSRAAALPTQDAHGQPLVSFLGRTAFTKYAPQFLPHLQAGAQAHRPPSQSGGLEEATRFSFLADRCGHALRKLRIHSRRFGNQGRRLRAREHVTTGQGQGVRALRPTAASCAFRCLALSLGPWSRYTRSISGFVACFATPERKSLP